jgi:hypothetical protein
VDWGIAPEALMKHALSVAQSARKILPAPTAADLRTLSPEALGLLLKDSISPLPLHKSLVLLEQLRLLKNEKFFRHELLALAKTLVFSASNLQYALTTRS